MLTSALAFLTLQTAAAAPAPPPGPALDLSRARAVVVGVLEWKSRGLRGYSKRERRDQAFFETLIAGGMGPERGVLLLDGQATRDAVLAALATQAAAAEPDATLLFYYAGHGLRERGETCLANYEIDTQRPSETGLCATALGAALSEFRGERALFFADCCFSGGLAQVAEQLPRPAAVLTSVVATRTSTGNWTFTESLIDSFAGSALEDTDGDGALRLDEAVDSVRAAMEHLELQPAAFTNFDVDPRLVLSHTSLGARAPEVAFDAGTYARVEGSVVRVLGVHGEHRVVRGQDYMRMPPVVVPLASLSPLAAPKPQPGEHAVPPEPLPDAQALERARAGRYDGLLHTLNVPNDVRVYGAFHDFGPWQGTRYAGQGDLNPGFWVYVYPKWYVWERRR